MPRQVPEPGPDDEQDATSANGQPRFEWVPGSTGPTGEPRPAGLAGGAVAGGGWPGGMDYQALLEALAAGGFLDGQADDQDAELADELAAEQDGRMGAADPGWTAALAVEHMDPGPAMAGWLDLAAAAAPRLDENALAAVAIAAQKLASRAQAAGLAAAAQISARAAAADRRIGVAADGRPGRIGRDAIGQVGLALTLTDYAAAEWADLAVTLSWRLRATGAALAAGRIDLTRAQLIATATTVLDDDAARTVEAAVLPGAAWKTTAQLRKRLRHALIAADPNAADRRRDNAERHAQVCLYGDDDGTATLTGTGLPAVEAAAAMARITAIARAMKAAGQSGGLDLHRARVMIGLLLGTLPYIPPPGGAPEPPPSDAPEPPPDQPPPPGEEPGHQPTPGNPGADPNGDRGPGGGLDHGAGLDDGWPDDLPAPGDEDAPPDDGLDGDGTDQAGPSEPAAEDDDLAGAGPAPDWPELGVIPPALARSSRLGPWRPVPGLLDVTLPWTTLAGLADAPGTLGRIGPITPTQARHLATAAANDPATQWRVIITNAAGQAIAVTRIRRRTRAGPSPPSDRPPSDRPPSDRPSKDGPPGTGLVGRATVIISQDTISQHTQSRAGKPRTLASSGRPGEPAPAGRPSPPGGITAAALQAAARALDQALAQAAADAAAGGCAHAQQSPAYRPPPRQREHVTARDQTCRFPTCGQPAWRADLDHTIPHDQGGRSCTCNLGGSCRKHHILKQDPRWKLDQTQPGQFTWTTPAGRTYTVGPDTYPL
jgi:hypothetical protein